MLASGTTATIKRNDGFGHEEQFLLPRPSGRFRFSQRTFAGAHGNDADAPKPAAPWYSVERAGSTHCRHLHQIPASAWTRSLASSGLFEVTGPPGLVQEGLGRAVESQDDKIALTRNRPQPVLFLARRRRWTEIKVERTFRIRCRLVARSERGEGPPIVEAGSRQCIVKGQRPEVGGRNTGRQPHPV